MYETQFNKKFKIYLSSLFKEHNIRNFFTWHLYKKSKKSEIVHIYADTDTIKVISRHNIHIQSYIYMMDMIFVDNT